MYKLGRLPIWVLHAYLSQCCQALLPTKPHYSSGTQTSVTSAWTTCKDFICFGDSFKSADIYTVSKYPCHITNTGSIENHFTNFFFNA